MPPEPNDAVNIPVDGQPVGLQLERLARRLFWWKTPAEAVADRVRFLVQLMTFGTWDDVCVARRFYSDEDFRAVLQTPPPGVFGARSWSYWHCVVGSATVPPMPKRCLP